MLLEVNGRETRMSQAVRAGQESPVPANAESCAESGIPAAKFKEREATCWDYVNTVVGASQMPLRAEPSSFFQRPRMLVLVVGTTLSASMREL